MESVLLVATVVSLLVGLLALVKSHAHKSHLKGRKP
jgi:hypothetical protein